MRMHGYCVSTATLGFARPKAAVSAVNEERNGCGVNTVLEVGAGKLVNLRPRATAVELPV